MLPIISFPGIKYVEFDKISNAFLLFTIKFCFFTQNRLFYPYASMKMPKKTGQKLTIFSSNFYPQTTTSCGLLLCFLVKTTILHQNYYLNMARYDRKYVCTACPFARTYRAHFNVCFCYRYYLSNLLSNKYSYHQSKFSLCGYKSGSYLPFYL